MHDCKQVTLKHIDGDDAGGNVGACVDCPRVQFEARTKQNQFQNRFGSSPGSNMEILGDQEPLSPIRLHRFGSDLGSAGARNLVQHRFENISLSQTGPTLLC